MKKEKQETKIKKSRLLADIPTEAYNTIKIATIKKEMNLSDMVKDAVRSYLQLDLTDEELGMYLK